MPKIEIFLEQIISSLKDLTEQEKFPLYAQLHRKYSSALSQFEKNKSTLELKDTIRWTTRMILEAPPNNGELGLKILEEITELYSRLPDEQVQPEQLSKTGWSFRSLFSKVKFWVIGSTSS